MTNSLDDLVTIAGDIKDTLSQLPEHLAKIEQKLNDMPVGEVLDQAKVDAAMEALQNVKDLANQALSKTDQLDGEDGA